MTTITATPDTATASVQLSIPYTSPVTRVLRNDANGVAEVRTLDGQLPTGSSGTLILTDYEASAGVNNYTAYVNDIDVHTNHCTNGSFEAGTTGWSLTGVTATTTTAFAQMAKSGTSILQATSNGTSTSPQLTSNVGMAAGNWVGMSAFLASEQAGNIEVRIQIAFRDAGAANISFVSSPWQRLPWYSGGFVSGTWQAPANTASAVVYLQMRDGDAPAAVVASGVRLWADAVLVVRGNTQSQVQSQLDGGFFDGSTPNTDLIQYTWNGTANASATTKTILTPQVAASSTLTLDKPWLMVPVMPNYALQAESITRYGSSRESRSTVHAVIGRSDPLVSFGPLGTRTGTLEIWCESLKAARDLESVFTRGETVMLKQNVSGMDMYFVGSSTGIAPYSVQGEGITRWALDISYTEIKRPLAPLAGALGWDFNALAAAYASFDVVTSKFATFDDLTIRNEN
jgi:hypothetical protein